MSRHTCDFMVFQAVLCPFLSCPSTLTNLYVDYVREIAGFFQIVKSFHFDCLSDDFVGDLPGIKSALFSK